MKKYIKTFITETATVTTKFDKCVFGRIAAMARQLGVSCTVIGNYNDDGGQEFAEDGAVSALLIGPASSVDELIYRLWETFEISEDVA